MLGVIHFPEIAMIRTTSLYVLLAGIFLALAGCHNANKVVFWPHDSVKKTASDLTINDERQLGAIKNAKPETDAERAWASGDLRFIGDRFVMARFQGIPYDSVVHETVERNGFKVIAYSDALRNNAEFIGLKKNYEEEYNKRLHTLATNGLTQRKP